MLGIMNYYIIAAISTPIVSLALADEETLAG